MRGKARGGRLGSSGRSRGLRSGPHPPARRSSSFIGSSAAALACDWPGWSTGAPPLGSRAGRPASGRRRVRSRCVRQAEPGLVAGTRRSGHERERCRPLQVTRAQWGPPRPCGGERDAERLGHPGGSWKWGEGREHGRPIPPGGRIVRAPLPGSPRTPGHCPLPRPAAAQQPRPVRAPDDGAQLLRRTPALVVPAWLLSDAFVCLSLARAPSRRPRRGIRARRTRRAGSLGHGWEAMLPYALQNQSQPPRFSGLDQGQEVCSPCLG